LTGAQLQGATLTGAQFETAYADPETNWPAGFDPRRAGVVLIDARANTTGEPES
jgi:hypothetical protein